MAFDNTYHHKQYNLYEESFRVIRTFTYEYLKNNPLFDAIPGVRNSATMDYYLDHESRNMVVALRASVLRDAKQHTSRYCLDTPLTWWDMFKQTYFNEFLLKYFPIKMKSQYFDYEKEIRYCPHSDRVWPDRHVDFLTFDDREKQDDIM